MEIAFVTPLRNEINNIDRLIASIEAQTTHIHTWIILENDSSDGSKEKLRGIGKLSNVRNLIILNLEQDNKSYALGTKYASIVNIGFDYIKQRDNYDKIDLIGILDADCFPEENFYKNLSLGFSNDEKLGISSGLAIYEDTGLEKDKKDWVIGNCRLWRKSCLEDCGYIIGPSADTLSVAKALTNDWKVYAIKDIFVHSREKGERINFRYYGESVYFRGHIALYAIIRMTRYLWQLKLRAFCQFGIGYFQAYIQRRKRVNDPQIRKYFQRYLLRYL